MAEACGVSRRTIFRDLETLREAGVPVEFDREEERYSIASDYFLPPTNFTTQEALALMALAGQVSTGAQLPFYEQAQQAALKLESSLPQALRDELQTLTRSIQINVKQVAPLEDKQDIYQQLLDAIARRKVVRIDYESFTEWEPITTKLRPYRLLFSRHSWYVIGRSSLHTDIRTFNLSRISELTMLEEKYSVPRGFNLDRYLRNAWHLIPEVGRDRDVVVKFQPLVARNVAEVVWHKKQQTKFLEDGSLEFRVRVSGLNEIAWWILGYGDQAEVLKPAKLRKLIAHRVSNMHAIYNGEK